MKVDVCLLTVGVKEETGRKIPKKMKHKMQRCLYSNYSCILKAVNFYFLFIVLYKATSLHQK